jgi:hypothetical protein
MSLADDAVQHLDRLGAVILDDVGDGPRPADLAAAATAARDAVALLAIPALTQLTGLVSGVADAVARGATEWSPSLGGTLMSAVDDLRHLAARASEFSDEDSEHLHHRAAELSAYVREGGGAPVIPSGSEDAAAAVVPSGSEGAAAAVIPSEAREKASVSEASPAPASVTPTPAPAVTAAPIVPIETLFYADAGPHIVSGGVPEAVTAKSDLLGRGIDALDNLVAKPIAPPVTFGAMEVVAVETLLYRGRAALERAAALREQIKASGAPASPAALDEMYDLIGLALKD